MTEVKGLLSVIIPTYHHHAFLAKTLNDVTKQNYRSTEIIVVIDGQDEKTEKIVYDFQRKDRRVITVHKKYNSGVNRAILSGVKKASGEFLVFVSSDDWLQQGFFKANIDFFKCFPNAEICVSDASTFTDRSKNDVLNVGLCLAKTPAFFDKEQVWQMLKSQHFHVSANTTFYRRRTYLTMGKHRPQLEEFADWYLNLKIVTNCGMGYLPTSFVYTRIHKDAYHLKREKGFTRKVKTMQLLFRHIDRDASRRILERFISSHQVPTTSFCTFLYVFSKRPLNKLLTPKLVLFMFFKSVWHGYCKHMLSASWRRAVKQTLLKLFNLSKST